MSRNYRNLLPCASALILLVACQSTSGASANSPAEELANWMSGIFTSADQAETQPDDFYAVRLVTAPIWRERLDGPWLYVEQAMVGNVDAPYRQRVYRLEDSEQGMRSVIYTLPNDGQAFVGMWMEPGKFNDYSPEMLTERAGCTIELQRSGSKYLGSTNGSGCSSSLGEASHATSEVTISKGRILSWDRGWTPQGEQAWGSTAGPYEFVRVAELF